LLRFALPHADRENVQGDEGIATRADLEDEAWSRQTGNELLRSTTEDNKFVFFLRKA
jgi:hypothetical protein